MSHSNGALTTTEALRNGLHSRDPGHNIGTSYPIISSEKVFAGSEGA